MTHKYMSCRLIHLLGDLFDDFSSGVIMCSNLIIIKNCTDNARITIWNQVKMNFTMFIVQNHWLKIFGELTNDVIAIFLHQFAAKIKPTRAIMVSSNRKNRNS